LQDIKIAKEKAQVVPLESIDALLGKIALTQKAVLYDTLENQMPHRLTGCNAAEMRKKLRKVADQICEVMKKDVTKWKQSLKTQIQTD